MNTDHSRLFRWLHGVWAAMGAIACVLLALAKGHPPGLVFIPFAVAAWALGHGALWLIRRLLIRSERFVQQNGTATGSWPPFLVLLAICFGVVFVAGLILIAWKLVFGGLGVGGLMILLVVCAPPSLCFLGILLRKNWARLLASTFFFVVAGFLVFEAASTVMRGRRLPLDEWLAVFAIIFLLAALGLYLLLSRRIKAFFGQATP